MTSFRFASCNVKYNTGDIFMTTMTKATIITWLSYTAQDGNALLNDERQKKLTEMFEAGKTDNEPIQVNPRITIRHWADQTAAEEYRDFMLALSEKYGGGRILSIKIEDI